MASGFQFVLAPPTSHLFPSHPQPPGGPADLPPNPRHWLLQGWKARPLQSISPARSLDTLKPRHAPEGRLLTPVLPMRASPASSPWPIVFQCLITRLSVLGSLAHILLGALETATETEWRDSLCPAQTSWVSQGTWQLSADLSQDSENRKISKLAAREANRLVENPDASLCLVSQGCVAGLEGRATPREVTRLAGSC